MAIYEPLEPRGPRRRYRLRSPVDLEPIGELECMDPERRRARARARAQGAAGLGGASPSRSAPRCCAACSRACSSSTTASRRR